MKSIGIILSIFFITATQAIAFSPVAPEKFIPEPPTNLQLFLVQESAFLSWLPPAPNTANATHVATKIFRNGELLDSINSTITQYYDMFLECGSYDYYLTAVYTTTTGNIVESDSSNHAMASFFIGPPLPFLEDWNSTNFSYNSWMPIQPFPNAVEVAVDPATGEPVCRFNSFVKLQELNPTLPSSTFASLIEECTERLVSFDLKCRKSPGSQSPFVFRIADRDSVYVCDTIAATSDSNWQHFSDIRHCKDWCERLFFESAAIDGDTTPEWLLDNISIGLRYLPVSNLKVTATEGGNQLSWTTQSCNTIWNYRQYLITRYDGEDSITSIFAPDTSLFDSVASPLNYCYTVTVVATNPHAASASLPTEKVCSAAVAVPSPEQKFKLLPNPSSGCFVLETSENITEITIFNLTGQPVYNQSFRNTTSNKTTITVPSKTTDGIYLVQIKFADGAETVKKLVLNR